MRLLVLPLWAAVAAAVAAMAWSASMSASPRTRAESVVWELRSMLAQQVARREALSSARALADDQTRALLRSRTASLGQLQAAVNFTRASCDRISQVPASVAASLQQLADAQVPPQQLAHERAALDGLAHHYLSERTGIALARDALAQEEQHVAAVSELIRDVMATVAQYYLEKRDRMRPLTTPAVRGGASRSLLRDSGDDHAMMLEVASERRATLSAMLARAASNARVAALLDSLGVAEHDDQGNVVSVRVGSDVGGALFEGLRAVRDELDQEAAQLHEAQAANQRLNDTLVRPAEQRIATLKAQLRDRLAHNERLRRRAEQLRSRLPDAKRAFDDCVQHLRTISSDLHDAQRAAERLHADHDAQMSGFDHAIAQIDKQLDVTRRLYALVRIRLEDHRAKSGTPASVPAIGEDNLDVVLGGDDSEQRRERLRERMAQEQDAVDAIVRGELRAAAIADDAVAASQNGTRLVGTAEDDSAGGDSSAYGGDLRKRIDEAIERISPEPASEEDRARATRQVDDALSASTEPDTPAALSPSTASTGAADATATSEEAVAIGGNPSAAISALVEDEQQQQPAASPATGQPAPATQPADEEANRLLDERINSAVLEAETAMRAAEELEKQAAKL